MTTPDASTHYSRNLLDSVATAFARLLRAAASLPVDKKDLKRNLVLKIVDEANEAGAEMTVGALADRLLVDPSVSSRTVNDCISNGHLVRAVSQQDGRRSVLRLTEDGTAFLDTFRYQQRQAFECVTRDWIDTDRLEFARLLIKYSESITQLPTPGTACPAPIPPVV